MLEYEIGDVVVSIAGRDIGDLYIIMDLVDNYALLVDGRGKTILKPKKKETKTYQANRSKKCGSKREMA